MVLQLLDNALIIAVVVFPFLVGIAIIAQRSALDRAKGRQHADHQ